MKLTVFLALISVALGATLDRDQRRINGENGWYVPQVHGASKWIPLRGARAMFESFPKDRAATVVEFYLYTKANPKTPQKISASDAVIKASNFNKANPTRFVIHGWTDSYKGPINTSVRDAWLSKGDFNVIVIDWSSRSQSPNYASSVYYVPAVGQLVAEFIDYLNTKQGMSMTTLTVIGHSLGAHVAGFTGKNTKKQINTIVGLDPALPLYNYDNPSTRLASTDAFYVESIQTNGGNLGFLKPIGKSTFYPNGGQTQPGCAASDNSCSHARSYMYYSESIQKNDFPSMKCGSYENAVKKNCGSTYSSVRLGAVSNANSAAGNFYTPVKSTSPFGMGA